MSSVAGAAGPSIGFEHTSNDLQAIDYVLCSLITDASRDLEWVLPDPPPRRVFYQLQPVSMHLAAGDINQVLQKLAFWRDLAPEEQAGIREATEQLTRRETSPHSLRAYRPTDRRIHVQLAQQELLRAPIQDDGWHPIGIWPPGFSRNGELAVVMLNLSCAAERCWGLFVLRRHGRRWGIVGREFAKPWTPEYP